MLGEHMLGRERRGAGTWKWNLGGSCTLENLTVTEGEVGVREIPARGRLKMIKETGAEGGRGGERGIRIWNMDGGCTLMSCRDTRYVISSHLRAPIVAVPI